LLERAIAKGHSVCLTATLEIHTYAVYGIKIHNISHPVIQQCLYFLEAKIQLKAKI